MVSTNCCLFSVSQANGRHKPHSFLALYAAGFFPEGFKAIKIVIRMEYVILFVLNDDLLQQARLA